MNIEWVELNRLLAYGLDDLAVEHWKEVANDQKAIPYAPDWDRYRAQEKLGAFKVAGVFAEHDLIGYNGFFIHEHMHYSTTKFAVNDVIYVDPEYRGVGGKVIRWCETALAALGVKKVLYHTKPNVLVKEGKTVGDLLEHMGYNHVESVYGKLL